jgi:hypothetical protein
VSRKGTDIWAEWVHAGDGGTYTIANLYVTGRGSSRPDCGDHASKVTPRDGTRCVVSSHHFGIDGIEGDCFDLDDNTVILELRDRRGVDEDNISVRVANKSGLSLGHGTHLQIKSDRQTFMNLETMSGKDRQTVVAVTEKGN